jgi:hypothetical protein
MKKYIKVVLNEIEAEQFNPPLQIPRQVINVYEMGEGTKKKPTWFTGEVWTNSGKVRIKAGDWVVSDDRNELIFIVSDIEFKQNID